MSKQLLHIPLTDIVVSQDYNYSRKSLTPLDVNDLCASIREHGQLQPVVVQPTEPGSPKPYLMVAGFRRYLATQILADSSGGMKYLTIEAVVTDKILTPEQAITLNLTENLQRKDLTIMEEAGAISKLKQYGYTQEDCARAIGKSKGWVQVRYMLLELPPDIQDAVDGGVIKQTDVREIYKAKLKSGPDGMYAKAREIKEARAGGQKESKIVVKTDPNAKRQRKKKEMLAVQDYVRDQVGDGIMTQILGWAAGEISSDTMGICFRTFFEEVGVKAPDFLTACAHLFESDEEVTVPE